MGKITDINGQKMDTPNPESDGVLEQLYGDEVEDPGGYLWLGKKPPSPKANQTPMDFMITLTRYELWHAWAPMRARGK